MAGSILGTVAMSEGVEDDNRPPVRSGLVAFVRGVVVSPDLSTTTLRRRQGVFFEVVVFVESMSPSKISSKATESGCVVVFGRSPYAVRSYDDSAHEGDKIPSVEGGDLSPSAQSVVFGRQPLQGHHGGHQGG